MSFNPRPVLLFGQTAVCEPVIRDGVPTLSHEVATLVGELAITWGRDDHWAQPEPATLTFTFFDPSVDWAYKIGLNTAIGIGCHLSIDIPPGHGIAEVIDNRYVIFQGFTTRVDAERRRVLTSAGWRSGWFVTVTAGDRTSSLGNVPFTFEDWRAERMIDRAVRLRDRSAGTGIRQYYYDAAHKNGTVRAVEIRDKTGLDIAHDLYGSFGHQWTYHPNRNVVNRIPEHAMTEAPFLTEVAGGEITVSMPDLADWTGDEAPIDRAPHVGTFVDGCTVESDPRMSTDQMSNITRVEAKWENRHDGGRTILTYSTKLFALAPFRTLSFDSWFDDGRTLDPVHASTSNKAFYQQAGPHHPAITYRTAPFDGFRNSRHAIWFLTPAERRGYAFLTGSPWIADIGGVAPIVTPCGGRIAYADGDWTVTANLLRGHRTTPANPIRWDSLEANITWNGAQPLRKFMASITWGDLWFAR